MNLSQALRQMAKLKSQIAEADKRTVQSVTYIQPHKPAYDFATVCDEGKRLRAELITLKGRIARTNAQTTIDVLGETTYLTEAIIALQEAKGQIAFFRGLNVLAQGEVTTTDHVGGGYGQSPVERKTTQVCALPQAERDAEVARLQERFDAVNTEVEAANHRTILVD